VQEYLIITGLVIIIQQAKELFFPVFISHLLEQPTPSAITRTEYNIKAADYKMVKEVYNKVIPG
jgi:hypothetical protein